MKYIISALMLAWLLLFPQKAYCQSFYYSYAAFDENGVNTWVQASFSPFAHNEEALAKAALEALFSHTYITNTYPYPENTNVLFAFFENGNLTVNISKEFNDFGGGSYTEKILTAQILKTLLDIDTVETVTLLIDAKLGNSPEGLIIKEVCSWQELTDEIIQD